MKNMTKVTDPVIEVVEPRADILTPVAWLADYTSLTEVFGRTCYKSEDRITPESSGPFVRKICRNNHLSVLEHLSITVRFTCSRATSHQLVRHRIAAYSQESMRYCNYGKGDTLKVIPPTPLRDVLRDGDLFRFTGSWAMDYAYASKGAVAPCPRDVELLRGDEWKWEPLEKPAPKWRGWAYNALTGYQTYLDCLDEGWKPEDARYNLPIGTKTEVVATFNLRQWRHVFQERALNKHAQREIRELMLPLLEQFKALLPQMFDDL